MIFLLLLLFTTSQTDTAITSGIVASRLLDYTSTESCIHSKRCEEKELPFVKSKAFPLFEIGSAATEIYLQHLLIKHKHRNWSRIIGAADASTGIAVAIHNYMVSK